MLNINIEDFNRQIIIQGNVPSSKNSRIWTGKRLISSKAVQKWRKDTAWYWKQYKDLFLELIKYDEYFQEYNIIKLYTQFIRKTRHKFDYINPMQTIQDEMVKYDWIPDDNADILLPVFLPYKYDKENPGVIFYFKI